MTTAPVNNPLLALGMRVGRWRHLLVPGAILTLLTVLVVPLPPAILDVLIADLSFFGVAARIRARAP